MPPLLRQAMMTPGAGPSTWNPSDKSANITLSGSNLIATQSANNGTDSAVRGTVGKNAGKYHFEITMNTILGSDSGIGLANHSQSLSTYLGSSGSNSIALFAALGQVFINNTSIATYQDFTDGDVVAVEMDFTAQLIYFWKNGSSRSTGYSTATIAGPLFPAECSNNTTDSKTANFGASPFVISPTSGFGPWT